jgi:hypothetical protein
LKFLSAPAAAPAALQHAEQEIIAGDQWNDAHHK